MNRLPAGRGVCYNLLISIQLLAITYLANSPNIRFDPTLGQEALQILFEVFVYLVPLLECIIESARVAALRECD
jgi:hypothetical protein